MKPFRTFEDEHLESLMLLEQRKVLSKFKQDAAGRVCGTCTHYRGTWCTGNPSEFGAQVIYSPQAVACRNWRAE